MAILANKTTYCIEAVRLRKKSFMDGHPLSPEINKQQAYGREIGNDNQCNHKQGKKWQGGPVKCYDRFIKTVAGEKEIQANRGSAVTDLQIGQKDDAKVDQIYIVCLCNGNYERHYKNQGRKNIKH